MKGVPMPKKYVHFTDEQKEQARKRTSASCFCLQGETLKRSRLGIRMEGWLAKSHHPWKPMVSSV